jgi:CheY-like chemotaxis protein
MTQFLTHSTDIVKNFLQTAVFLDDLAEMACITEASSSISEPFGDTVAAMKTDIAKDVENNNENRLDAEKIINTFMQKGIVCSVLRHKKLDKVEDQKAQKESYITLMKKADLIVLDWDMYRDGGTYTTEIIQSLQSDQDKTQPFRSIIIYTAESLDDVKSKLTSYAAVNFGTPESFTSIGNKYTHISLYNKPGSKAATLGRSVPFEQL